MTSYTLNIGKKVFKDIRKIFSIIVLTAFIGTSIKPPAYGQLAQEGMMPWMPKPGIMMHLSPEFTPAYLKGIVIHPENALKFDFIVYKGDQEFTDSQKRQEYTKLIKYFMASLAVPDEDQWVNLSPYEKDRIIKSDFGRTEMGRDLLAQDYLLKQITASLIYPEEKLGQKFWDKVYSEAQQQYGTTNIPVNTFNKVWILPDDALIYEKGNTAYVLRNHLKVMLEEDYLSLAKHSAISTTSTHSIASKIVKEIVLPALEKEVNEGKNFAPLRQVYSGMLLAAWYKRALKESLLSKIYANKSRLKGVDQDPRNNEAIYQQYLKAYKKGVFNFIREDVDKYTNEVIPRKYFSGGMEDYVMSARELGHETLNTTGSLTDIQNTVVATEINNDDLAQVSAEETESIGVRWNLNSTQTVEEIKKVIVKIQTGQMGKEYLQSMQNQFRSRESLEGIQPGPQAGHLNLIYEASDRTIYDIAGEPVSNVKSDNFGTALLGFLKKHKVPENAKFSFSPQGYDLVVRGPKINSAMTTAAAEVERIKGIKSELRDIFRDLKGNNLNRDLRKLRGITTQEDLRTFAQSMEKYLHLGSKNFEHLLNVISQLEIDHSDNDFDHHGEEVAATPEKRAFGKYDAAMLVRTAPTSAKRTFYLNSNAKSGSAKFFTLGPGQTVRVIIDQNKGLSYFIETSGDVDGRFAAGTVAYVNWKDGTLLGSALSDKPYGGKDSIINVSLSSATEVKVSINPDFNDAAMQTPTTAPKRPSRANEISSTVVNHEIVNRLLAFVNKPNFEDYWVRKGATGWMAALESIRLELGVAQANFKSHPKIIENRGDLSVRIPGGPIRTVEIQDIQEAIKILNEAIKYQEFLEEFFRGISLSRNLSYSIFDYNYRVIPSMNFEGGHLVIVIQPVQNRTPLTSHLSRLTSHPAIPQALISYISDTLKRSIPNITLGTAGSKMGIMSFGFNIRDAQSMRYSDLVKDDRLLNWIIKAKQIAFDSKEPVRVVLIDGKKSVLQDFGNNMQPSAVLSTLLKSDFFSGTDADQYSFKVYKGENYPGLEKVPATGNVIVVAREKDSAMAGPLANTDVAEFQKGGIDLNAANLNLQIKRDGNGVPLPISQQNLENIHIDGLIPVIIDIKPAIETPLLSQLQAGRGQELAKI